MNHTTSNTKFTDTLERQMIQAALNAPAPFSRFEGAVFAAVMGTCGILLVLLFHRL